MPSIEHEGLLQPFDNRPELVAELLAGTDALALPAWRNAQVRSADLTELVPTEFRADRVVVLSNAKSKATLGVVLEVQLSENGRKRFSWPMYVAGLRARLRCPVVVLVVSPSASTAAWCAKPIKLGPGSVVTPVVVGPDRLPVITDVDKARSSPDLSALSALVHGAVHPDRNRVLTAFLEALGVLWTVDRDRAEVYHDVVRAALPTTVRRYLEEQMSAKTWVFRSDFAIRHRREGEAIGKFKGKAQALLAVLEARGIEVPKDARERISECNSTRKLNTWVRRAATADSIKDLFSK